MAKTHSPQLPHSNARRWLIAYDIRDTKRLQLVWRYLRHEGIRLQYSVYLLAGTPQHVNSIVEHLRGIIDERKDDVRIYPLTETTRIWGFGTQFKDDGNILCDGFIDRIKQIELKPNFLTKEDRKELSFSSSKFLGK
jgi:CRISPR-associated protein Cas2